VCTNVIILLYGTVPQYNIMQTIYICIYNIICMYTSIRMCVYDACVYYYIIIIFIIICVFLVRSASRSRILDGYTNIIYFIYVYVYPHLIHLIVVIMHTRCPQIVVVQGDIRYFSVRFLVRIARQVSFCFVLFIFFKFYKRTLNDNLLFIIYKFPLKHHIYYSYDFDAFVSYTATLLNYAVTMI